MANNVSYDCEIINIFFRNAYQRQGHGRRLWVVLWDDIVATYKPKNMVVWSVRAARGFYAAMGGREVDEKTFGTDPSYAYVWDL